MACMSIESCRVCLKNGNNMLNIFEKRYSSTISSKIMSLAKVQIQPRDGLPDTICRKCLKELDQCIAFVQLCECSDIELRTSLLDNVTESTVENGLSPKTENTEEEEAIKSLENDLHKIRTKNNVKKKAVKQQCSECGKILSSKFRLKTHLRTHSGERPFTCSHCSKTFGIKSDLALHIRIHTGEKPLKCEYCQATFRHPSSLRAHKRIHTGETPYHCNLCPKRFYTASNLQYHMRLHTGEKNFECDFCNKAFVVRGHLKLHLLSHTGERSYMCSLCGVRLSRATHLKRHLKHIHSLGRVKKEQIQSKEHYGCDDSQGIRLNIEEISLTPASEDTQLNEKTKCNIPQNP